MPNPVENSTPAVANPVQAARALIKELQEKFTVFRDCQPLAIGIDKQLLARLPELNKKILRMALRFHTQSVRYLKAMEKGVVRYDLDGNPGDALTEEHRAHAGEIIRERFKKDAEQRKAQREAEAAERRRSEKLDQLAAKFARRK